MTKEGIAEIIRIGVSEGIFSVDDMLIEANRLLEERVMNTVKESGGKIVFTDDYPRMVSCCFSQVIELDIKEIRFENDLLFCCEEPDTKDTYQLGVEDFLLGELRHVLDKIEK